MRTTRLHLFYGWYVIAAATLVMATCFGIIYSFSVYFVPLQSEFSWDRSATSGAFSLYLLLVGFFSIACGRAVDRFGPRRVLIPMAVITGASLVLTSQVKVIWQFYVTYSVLLAAGTGAIYIICMSLASRWFSRRRATAMGILGAGGSLGTVIMAPFSAWLIQSFQWRTAFMTTGILAWCLMIPAVLLLKGSPSEVGTGPDGDPEPNVDASCNSPASVDFSISDAMRTGKFWCMFLLWFWFSFCLYMVMTHIVPNAQDLGLTPVQAAGVMSIMTGMSVASRLAGGVIADRMDKAVLLGALFSVMALAMVGLSLARVPWMLYAFAVIYGISYGGTDTSIVAIVTDVFGTAKVGTMMGILMISWGMGSASGPYLAGWIFDLTGEYTWAFVTAASGLLLSAYLSKRLVLNDVRDNKWQG
ncbi:MAG: MFS transporter [Desulfobacterales bacterium]|nr:MFS transporter [Desulfobacterales bacterium]